MANDARLRALSLVVRGFKSHPLHYYHNQECDPSSQSALILVAEFLTGRRSSRENFASMSFIDGSAGLDVTNLFALITKLTI